jgi:hypothetical protein
MTARIPGLTPMAERTLHARLSAEIHTVASAAEGSAASLESLLPDLTRIVLEAIPATPIGSDVLVLVRRTQEISDALRKDGKAGLARDIDRLAGILHGLAVENINQGALLDEYRYATTRARGSAASGSRRSPAALENRTSQAHPAGCGGRDPRTTGLNRWPRDA